MRKLRIGLVTSYPPTQGRLSEYGWHLARHLATNSRVEQIHVLADRVPGASGLREGRLTVERCWGFDSFDFPLRVTQAVRGRNFDATWFNIHLASTGRRRLCRVCALSTPAALRLLRHPAVVTLHHLPDLTDLPAAGIQASRLDRLGAYGVVRLLGCASMVCTPLPEYADLLRHRYRAGRARFIPLGAAGLAPAGGVTRDPYGLLAFGRFGSYKRLEIVLAAVAILQKNGHPVRLHIGGSDSVYAPGYLSSLQRQYAHWPNITFHGYVPETEIPSLFQRCAAAVLPYRTMTGASSVAMQAAMYGTAILAADVPGLHLTRNLGLEMTFLKFEDPALLASELAAFLAEPVAHAAQIRHNLAYCDTVRMGDIVDAYLDEIERLDTVRYRGRMTVEMTSSVRS